MSAVVIEGTGLVVVYHYKEGRNVALPQELRFIMQRQSNPAVFESIPEATQFLKEPTFDFGSPTENFIYEITYSDGYEFERPVKSLKDLRKLHRDIERLAQHITSLTKK